MRFDVTTHASPEQVLRALTDFTDRRLQIWSRTLDPKTYQVRGLGDSWAVARESTPGSPFWVVVRYDWSDPTVVRWTEEESSYGGRGTGSVRIAPTDDGGSRLHVEWNYGDPSRTRDKVVLFLLHRGPMNRVISRLWASALNRYAQSDPD
ncbi:MULTISPECIES: SRPBCC family protein [Kribbella]|uniref:SRPBCC family protein n=1 Tax=Kribbella TaxID=182639 RepID=UPI001305285C|nr:MULTISPECIES: SRPBCC family protein [Kribbella]